MIFFVIFRNTWKVYHLVACNPDMDLRGSWMHAGHISSNKRIRQNSLSRFPCSNHSWQVTESSDHPIIAWWSTQYWSPIWWHFSRDDVIAQLYYARRLAEKLQPAAKLVELHGGHLVSHERSAEVNIDLSDFTIYWFRHSTSPDYHGKNVICHLCKCFLLTSSLAG